MKEAKFPFLAANIRFKKGGTPPWANASALIEKSGVKVGVIGIASIMVVSGRNPLTSAVFLLLDIIFLSALYAMLGADFLAAVQVIIYAGAILVLFLFVIMMLKLKAIPARPIPWPETVVLMATICGFGFVGWKIIHGATAGMESGGLRGDMAEAAAVGLSGNTQSIGMKLFSGYLWPFELVSVLILVAIIGGIMITRREYIAKSAAAPKAQGGRVGSP